MAYAIFRSDLMWATKNPAGIVNLKYSPSGTDTPIENGNVVLLGNLDTNERDVFIASTPAANSAIGSIAIVAEPEVNVDEREKNLNQFRNPAGAVVRGYKLHSGDMFSVTSDAVTPIIGTAPAANQIVELQAGTKLKLVTTPTSTSTQIGTVIRIEGDYIVIQVV
jgi:hypothetical protein